jgi:glucose-6-phosphate-specific signal transduction histidine kinase
VTDTGRSWAATPARTAAGVADDPAGPDGGTRTGHGILGMRERAAAFHGTLDAGPLPGGGFQVTAFLPTPGPAVGQVA